MMIQNHQTLTFYYSLPKTAEDFDESERMIIDWRKANKTWAEIDIEYERLTNTSTYPLPDLLPPIIFLNSDTKFSNLEPGNATIRKRYPKLLAVATTFTPAEVPTQISHTPLQNRN